MRPQKITPFPKTDGGDVCPDIVASVSDLANCLKQANTNDFSEAMETALISARKTELHVAELQEKIVDLERLAMTDELTGLLNRRGFPCRLSQAISAAKRYNDYGVLIYVDLDNFKPINDTFGHAAGDEVLRHVARLLQENVRDFDTVGRLGGDEFTVLLSRTSFEGGLKRAETLDAIINSSFLHWNGRPIGISASLGVLVFGPEASDPMELLNQADSAMYKNKRARSQHSKHQMLNSRMSKQRAIA